MTLEIALSFLLYALVSGITPGPANRREPLDIRGILNTLTAGKDLTRETAEMFMEDLTDGIMDERQMAAILTALSSKGPVTEEIAGCAKVLSSKKRKFPYSGDELTDIVGTGGDGKDIENLVDLLLLNDHLAVNAVKVFGSALEP